MKSLPMSKMQNFSVFIEEGKEKPEDRSEALERKRKYIEQMIKMLQSELRTIDKRLAHTYA